jgi:small subunit ribosomal protein S6
VKTTKRYYESMYIIDATLTDEQVDSIVAKYTKLIADQGGEVRAVGRWDKRRLAYDIQGRREGLYILMFFEAEAAVAKELDRVYRISDDVFRHLITRVELEHVDTSRIDHPQPTVEAAAPVAVEAEEAAEAAEEITEEAPVEAVEETVAEETAAEPAETVEEAEAEPVEAVEEPQAEPVEAVDAEAAPEVAEEVEVVEETTEEAETPAAETAPEEPVEEAAAEEPDAEAETSETTEGEEPVEEAAEAEKTDDKP